MNFKLQRRILLFGTILTLVITSAVFTFFIHGNNEATKIQMIENKLKGDAKSILPHLYLSGNFAWFKDNLEHYKDLGITCLSVRDISGALVWGKNEPCSLNIEARNYVDQKVLEISYDLPQITVLSTLQSSGISFLIFFSVQIAFLILAYLMLKRINKRHAETLVKMEHINGRNEANERILRLTRTLGHNLKSPLAAMKTLYELTAEKLSSDEKYLLKTIQDNVDLMASRLVDQGAEVLSSTHVDVSFVLDAVVGMKRLEFVKDTSLDIAVESGPQIHCYLNESELINILSNLINNAIEARKPNSRVRIAISGHRFGSNVEIKIRDNGVGIEPSKIEDFFKYGITTKTGGKGCGLYHAKEFVSLWGGKISISSAVGEYTEISISLPVSTQKEVKEIILIDNELLNILSWKGMANKYKIPFKGYTNSRDFFENAPVNKEEVEIYVDYELGEENGLEIVQWLKKEGFVNVSLATGESSMVHPGIRQVGKEFPIRA